MGQPDLRQADLSVRRRERGGSRIRGVGHPAVAPGTRIGPFRVERLLSRGSTGAVYEATQLSLRRAVALRLVEAGHFATPDELVRFDHRQRLAASLHHPNLVPYYEAGEWEGGRFIATRLIRGKTLAELRDESSLPAARAMSPLADALARAHAAGVTHGRVSAANILVEKDGTPYLADLGLGQAASPQADERALADALEGLPSEAARPLRTPRTRRVAATALAFVAGCALALAFVLGGAEEPAPTQAEPPPSPEGTSVVGSTLAPAVVEPLGCDDAPSPNTPACTIAPTRLDGEPLEIERAGVIRSWAVRGASGDVALQVIRERGGESFVAAFSQPESLGGEAPQIFAADIPVRRGDLIGVRLGPGATIGALPSVGDAVMARWEGGLTADSAAPAGAPLDGELMLRADVALGEQPEAEGLLVAAEAASAPGGRVIEKTAVALGGGGVATATVVQLPDGIAVDVFEGRTRLSRLGVPDADPAGELQQLEHGCGGAGASGFCVRWANPDEELALFHAYRVSATGRIREIG